MNNTTTQTRELSYTQKIAALPSMQFKHVLGGFKRDLEKEYYENYFTNSIGLIRLTLVLSALLVAAFGILDIWIVPLTKVSAWIIRFALITPVVIICFLLTFTSFFRKIMQFALCIVVLAGGIGFSIMIALLSESEQGFFLYYVGIIQVLIAGYALLRIRFVYATIMGLILIASYEIVAIFFNDMLSAPERIPIFLNNNFFLISTNIMGMIACYFNEFYLRHTFLLRKRIHYEEELVVENTKQELQLTKQELNQTQSVLKSMEQQTDVGLRSISNTIKNKQAVQKELNKNAARRMLMLRHSARELRDKVPKALAKTIAVVLDRFEQNVKQKLDENKSVAAPGGFEEMKKRITAAFEKQNLENIEHFISEKVREHSEEAIGSLDDAFKNMSDILAYIHAIIAYQRGQKIAIEGHVNSALKRVYYNMQYTYKKELTDRKIEFAFHNFTESLVVLPVYDFILEEDIIRNLFLNSFRALVEGDPDNTRDDKKIWIEVYEERIRGRGDCFIIHFKDNGPGIPSDKKQAIFEGYSTKTPDSGVSATGEMTEPGVGCRTIKSRVVEMGGNIDEIGTPGEGADFVITIAKHARKEAADSSFELAGKTLHSGE